MDGFASFEDFQDKLENVLDECQCNLQNKDKSDIKRILDMLMQNITAITNVCKTCNEEDVPAANVFPLSQESRLLLMALNVNCRNIYRYYHKKLFKLGGASNCGHFAYLISKGRKELPEEEVLNLHQQGFSLQTIANMFNVHYSTIYRLIIDWGGRPPSKYTPLNNEELTKMVKDLLNKSPFIG